jgi:VanZ family protein
MSESAETPPEPASAPEPVSEPQPAAARPFVAYSRADRIALAWLPAILYTSLIWWLSSQSLSLKPLEKFPFQDKGVHFVEYAGLCFAFCFAVTRTWRGRGLRALLTALLITAALGLVDELHQAFVPMRSSDIRDWFADAFGASFAVVVSSLVWRVRRARADTPPR